MASIPVPSFKCQCIAFPSLLTNERRVPRAVYEGDLALLVQRHGGEAQVERDAALAGFGVLVERRRRGDGAEGAALHAGMGDGGFIWGHKLRGVPE